MVWGGKRRGRWRRVCVEGRVGEDSVELGEYLHTYLTSFDSYLPYPCKPLLPT